MHATASTSGTLGTKFVTDEMSLQSGVPVGGKFNVSRHGDRDLDPTSLSMRFGPCFLRWRNLMSTKFSQRWIQHLSE